ncbi:MAG: hypothetical protein WBG71_04305 [Leeuwenhoekiella sp.]
MKLLVPLVIAFSISLLCDANHGYEPFVTNGLIRRWYMCVKPISNTAKEKAFKILQNKCNVCHYRRNRRRVFTLDNMNAWADDVYKQVFVKKRMPKGKDIKLTGQEYQELLTWISTTLIN